jgi:DNA (cytosine-5)-methyltransferase 1
MRFGSVCSGIEAASVAWHPLGWRAAWLSEIEPFPSAVLAHHYPDVPNLGDMTALPERILSGEVEAPDVFCGGTPCQAFSVAGLRNSLDDARGNLSLTFVGIANAIDHVRSIRSDDPAIIFWENVPGVLSTKDNAFGCFLGALAGEDDPVTCPDGKWPTAGVVVGQKRTVAWRVLDAQYFGVAQRRRRVFVVASARDDFDPAAVLFEFNGVRRDTAPSREAGQEPATGPASGLDVSHTGTLTAGFGKLGAPEIDAYTAIPVISPCLETQAGGFRQPCTQAYVAQPVVVHGTQDPCVSDIAFAQGRNNGGENVLMQPIAIQDVRPIEKAQNGRGWNDDGTAYTVDTHATQGVAHPMSITFGMDGDIMGDVMETITTREGNISDTAHAVMQPIPINTMNHVGRGDNHSSGDFVPGAPSYTLTKGHSHAVAQPIPFDTTQITSPANYSKPQAGDPCHPLAAGAHAPAVAQPVGVDIFNAAFSGEVAVPLTNRSDGTGTGPTVMQSMAVRRLTPIECERLQGFPDNYTNIPWRKKDESPDGPRYKALGNSWAVPVVAWIGKRINEAVK